jgi:hypothetical protein
MRLQVSALVLIACATLSGQTRAPSGARNITSDLTSRSQAGTRVRLYGDTWYDFFLHQFNPDNLDRGAWIEQRRQILLDATARNPFFKYSLVITVLLLVTMVFTTKFWYDLKKIRWIHSAQMADVLSHDRQSREAAREAIRPHNDHIEKCNRVIEAQEVNTLITSNSSCTPSGRRTSGSKGHNMLVGVTGFGSVWRRRVSAYASNPKRFARAAYFNTTGVMVNGRIVRHRKIVGHARFNGAGGFDPNYPNRMVGRVFECDDPCVWNGQNKVFFRRLVARPVQPGSFLVVVKSGEFGRLLVGAEGWKSDGTFLISLSEWRDQQETMLLMSCTDWVRTDFGRLVLVSDTSALLRASLMLS